ncbi:YesL family protein [uncultured Cellulomonas sp.]|uniref:YesL family protein n=1 Tax=uncultured Cellulomonas sp. TaxID=189682 RepID=UPI0028E573C4|nr:YesL family protein [uncultured Cellulomonas sp.]
MSASTDDLAVGGWAGRVMVFLRVGTQLVGINLLVVVGTLAGGVVLGAYPALGAGGALLSRLAGGTPSEHVWHDFWTAYRDGFRRLNVLGAPLTVGFLLFALDAAVLAAASAGPARAALTVGVVALAVYLVVALATLVPVARRYADVPASRTWRFVAVAPLLSPLTSLAVLVAFAVLAVTFTYVTVLVPLVGLSVPLLVSGWLVDQRLTALDARAA